MKRFSWVVFILSGALIAALGYNTGGDYAGLLLLILFLLGVGAASIQIADQWERVVVLRLGKMHALRGPGLFSSFR